MKINKFTLATIFAASVLFTSCKKENPETGEESNVATPAVSDIVTSSFSHATTGDAVSAYSMKFTREDESTVSFGGQTTRLKQAKEIGGNLKGNSGKSVSVIQTQFEEGNGFSESALDNTTSGKKVRNKISSSTGLFGGSNTTGQGQTNVEAMDAFISGHGDVASATSTTATAGNAGKAVEAGGSTRYVDAKGRELDQLFTKSLNGALAYDQCVNHYFNRLDDNNDGTGNWKEENDAGTVKEGTNYTFMEHHWDEGFGYIYGNTSSENLIYKYIDNVDQLSKFSGLEKELFESFTNGRLAIVKKDYMTRDNEIKNIREKLALVIAVRAVNYIAEGANLIGDLAADEAGRIEAFHDLSEGYGFVNSLRYLVKADGTSRYFTDAEVDTFLATLDAGKGFWTVSKSDLLDMADDIAAKNVGGLAWAVSDIVD